MSYRSSYFTHSTTATVQNRIREAHRALDGVALTAPRLDLDMARSVVETFLDDLAELPSTVTLECQDCGAPLPEFRVRRWYHPQPHTQVFDVLCRSCDATREDAQDATVAFAACR